MIARNASDTLPTAIKPFLGRVDEISIVLGGASDDDTERIARRYADVVRNYDGALAEDGSLEDFAAARQQSFDNLSVDYDWVIVVDSDDVWTNAEAIYRACDDADKVGATNIAIEYQAGGSTLTQPRIFKPIGEWRGAIHEQYIADNAKTHICPYIKLTQRQPIEIGRERLLQNIRIEERLLAEQPENQRVLQHYFRDLANAGRYDEAYSAAARYIELHGKQKAPLALLNARLTAAACLLQMGDASHLLLALGHAIEAVRLLDIAPAWGMLTEAFSKIAGDNPNLNQVVKLLAREAVFKGNSRTGMALDDLTAIHGSAFLLGQAEHYLGNREKALKTWDLAQHLRPNDTKLSQLIQDYAYADR